MLPAAFESLQGSFSRVFIVGLVLPVLAVSCVSLAVALEAAWDLRTAIEEAAGQPAFTQGLIVFGGLVAVTVIAVLLGNFQYSITRVFEGYWPIAWLRRRRAAFHLRRARWMGEQARGAFERGRTSEALEWHARQQASYPPLKHADRIMPTQLGNILRASELYAFDRYGIDSVLIWPRLRPLVPPEQAQRLDDNKVGLDLMLLLTLLLRAFALVWCVTLALTTKRWDLFLMCAAAWPIAWLTYRNALQAALAYSEQVKATFDLHRHELIEALGLGSPADGANERRLWDAVAQFYAHNLPMDDPAAAPAGEPGAR